MVGPLPFVVRAPAQYLALRANQVVAMMGEVAAGPHAGFLSRMDGNVRRDVPFFRQIVKLTVAVAGVSRQRPRLQRQTFQQTDNRFGFRFGGVGHPSGQDEPTQVHDDVLLVLQPRLLADPGGLPTGVGVHWVQWHPALETLEVPHLLVFYTIAVNGSLG